MKTTGSCAEACMKCQTIASLMCSFHDARPVTQKTTCKELRENALKVRLFLSIGILSEK
jgi:hypothetical protein